MNAQKAFVSLLCAPLLFVVFLYTAEAQSLEGFTQARLETTPQYPTPNSNVGVSLNTGTLNTVGALIQWYINGTENTAVKNAREISTSVGPLGSETTISAVLTLQDGTTVTAERTILPARLDLIIESDTSVPFFYKGRAQPSAESTIRAVALPHTSSDPTTLTYTWKLNGSTLFGGPVYGKNTAAIAMPLRGSANISVIAQDTAGAVVAQKSTLVEAVDLQTHFYIDNPLYGLNKNAISEPVTLTGEEITVRAETLHMSNDSSASADHTWSINGRTIDPQNDDPRSITLRRSGDRGSFEVGYSVQNLTQLLQRARTSFTIGF